MARAALPGRRLAPWRTVTIRAVRAETDRVATLTLDVPDWPGHRAGHHADVRLTAEDGDRRPAAVLDRLRARGPGAGDDRGAARGRRRVAVPDRRGAAGRPVRAARSGRLGVHVARRRRRAAAAGGGRRRAGAAAGDGPPPDRDGRGDRRARSSCRPARRPTSSTATSSPSWEAAGVALDVTLHARRAVPPRRRRDAGARPARAEHVFVCGPTAFAEAAAEHLLDLGHDAERIRVERFGGG